MKPMPTFDHPVHPLIQQRWSPRAFADVPLTHDVVLSLFEAARWAASSSNAQPWRFLYALKSETERFGKMVECLYDHNKEWAPNAPVLVVTMVKTHTDPGNKPNQYALHDLGLAIGNLTTQASSLDLYVHNMAGFSEETAKKLFSIPEGIEPVTMIAIGRLGDPGQLSAFNQQRELAAQTRKPLSELILHE
jgi:nitroreductase